MNVTEASCGGLNSMAALGLNQLTSDIGTSTLNRLLSDLL